MILKKEILKGRVRGFIRMVTCIPEVLKKVYILAKGNYFIRKMNNFISVNGKMVFRMARASIIMLKINRCTVVNGKMVFFMEKGYFIS